MSDMDMPPFSHALLFRNLATFGKFSAMFDKGDNFCDFLFAFVYIKFFSYRRETKHFY